MARAEASVKKLKFETAVWEKSKTDEVLHVELAQPPCRRRIDNI